MVYDALCAVLFLSLPIPIILVAPNQETLAKYYICVVIGNFSGILGNSIRPFTFEYLSQAGLDIQATKKLENYYKLMFKSNIIWVILSLMSLFLLQEYILKIYHIKNPNNLILGITVQMAYIAMSNIWCQSELILNYRNIMKPIYISNIIQALVQSTLSYILVQKVGFLGPIIANLIGSLTCASICYVSLMTYKVNIKPFGYV